MNILLIVGTSLAHQKEATNITTLNIAKELQKKGHNVIILCRGRKYLPRKESIDHIKIYRKHHIFLLDFISCYFITKNIQKENGIKFDVIHGFSSAPAMVLKSIFSRFATNKVKIIHTIKSVSHSFHGRHFFFLLKLANKVTVTSISVKNILSKKGINSVQCVRTNIDLLKFVPMNKNKLKKKYGFENKKVVLYYGGIHPYKGVEYLINAIPLIKNKNIHFIISSRFKTYRYADIQQKTKHDTRITTISGMIPVLDYVNMADVIVLPYTKQFFGTEASPSCLLEGMACKTPVVISNISAIKEIVTNGKDACMVEPENAQALANGILKVLNDKKFSNKLTQNAFEKVKEFDLKNVAKEFIELYS